jgi:eukaryotic-like serine/threonine-protein kinase
MLSPGTTLGPYRILAPLGAGGMGEVYRARDTRLARDVAIKVIRGDAVRDPERIRRFEQEARAAGALSHPNVCAIFDLGTHEGAPYVVMELLEGETLRSRLKSGPIPARKAVDWAAQTARGLAAAHAKGIVHRDLKPENLFVTTDGRVKVLDFGLAKLTQPEPAGEADATASLLSTETGAVMGTAGYMAPEQVRGEKADARTDLFALGAVVHEMVTGRRAFHGATWVETAAAILNEEPATLSASGREVPAGLEPVVRRCLEKRPAERFQSASDLAFALENLGARENGTFAEGASPKVRRSQPPAAVLAVVALAAAIGVGGAYLLWGRSRSAAAPPTFQGLTFHRGTIFVARFIPDDRSILYSASWEGNATHVYSLIPGTPESRTVIPGSVSVLAVSRTGEMALMLNPRQRNPIEITGTLARTPFAGGAPRPVIDDVTAADWSPDGSSLLVVRRVEGQEQLEYPIGKVLYRTRGWISDPRISPRGDRIAFLAHPRDGDFIAKVVIMDLAGGVRATSGTWNSAMGLAWTPDGSEVWFTAVEGAASQAVYAMSMAGRRRLVDQQAGSLQLHDIAADGTVLLSRYDSVMGLIDLDPVTQKEHDLSWFDWSLATDLTSDGRSVVFTEMGSGVGSINAVYQRGCDGSPAVRLGEGWGMSLSNDGRWVLAVAAAGTRLVALPTGLGATMTFLRGTIREYLWACWFPDRRRVLFAAVDSLRTGVRLYAQGVDGGLPALVDSLDVGGGYYWNSVSPDGSRAVFPNSRGGFRIRSFDKTAAGITTLSDGDYPIGWSADSRALFVNGPSGREVAITRVDVASGARTPWRTIRPGDAAGLVHLGPFRLTPDGRTYAYSYLRSLSNLYMVKGLK